MYISILISVLLMMISVVQISELDFNLQGFLFVASMHGTGQLCIQSYPATSISFAGDNCRLHFQSSTLQEIYFVASALITSFSCMGNYCLESDRPE